MGAGTERVMNWPLVLYHVHVHVLGLYGMWLLITEAQWLTVIFAIVVTFIGSIGITAGAHRLWAHASYTGSSVLRGFLMLANTSAGVGKIFDWVVRHRVHHKFYGTEKDPYNQEKGFIYSHLFANVMSDAPDYQKTTVDVDVRDVDYDGWVWVQRCAYWILFPIFGILLPINAPMEYWDESLINSLLILGFTRLAITTNVSWLIHSAPLIWGLKPGEKYPCCDTAVFFITRTFWPHYHYRVPWDYKTGEFGNYDRGCTTALIKTWEQLGLASNLVSPSSDIIRDALAKSVEKKLTVEECLEEARKLAELEAIKQKLVFRH